ncbi:helix-turn-helix domain-containing protein [Dinoroseobacter sp. S124A]|uniref:helix-turn-helix domain-containing protein n=1 Tax=Dinoroseobacter sp. S124A TaxID=3415128 RepID=UPI003C7A1FCD
MTPHIGEDIRALRKSRNWTLQALCNSVGRSVGWLSQVERGQTAPSIQDLSALAAEFEVPISFFFRSASQSEEERGLIVRGDMAEPIGSEESGLRERLLSPNLNGNFEMIHSTFSAHSACETLISTKGREDGGVVIDGQLDLQLGGTWFTLATGDSFQFSDDAYLWRNPYDAPATVIWIVSPPVY